MRAAKPLRFEQLSLRAELLQPPVELPLDLDQGPLDALLRQDEVLGRINVGVLESADLVAREGVDDRERFDLVPPQLDAVGEFLVGRPALDHVAAHAELAAGRVEVVALIVNVDELHQQLVAVDGIPDVQRDHHLQVVLGRAQAVDAAHAGHDDHVPAAHQGARGHQPQPVDLLVDRGVLLDVDVALRDVGFRLVIVVIADEVGDGVLGEELAELGVKLGGQRLVVREDQRRPLDLGDHVGHRERFARTRHSQEDLVPFPLANSAHERRDRLRLIAGRLELADKLKLRHKTPSPSRQNAGPRTLGKMKMIDTTRAQGTKTPREGSTDFADYADSRH